MTDWKKVAEELAEALEKTPCAYCVETFHHDGVCPKKEAKARYEQAVAEEER